MEKQFKTIIMTVDSVDSVKLPGNQPIGYTTKIINKSQKDIDIYAFNERKKLKGGGVMTEEDKQDYDDAVKVLKQNNESAPLEHVIEELGLKKGHVKMTKEIKIFDRNILTDIIMNDGVIEAQKTFNMHSDATIKCAYDWAKANAYIQEANILQIELDNRGIVYNNYTPSQEESLSEEETEKIKTYVD